MDSDSRLIVRLREKLVDEDLVEASRERYVIDCRQLDRWYEGTYGHALDPEQIELTSMDLAEYRGWLLQRNQPGTVIRKFASIRGMLKLLAPVVLTKIRMPKLPPVNRAAPSGFTKNERMAIFRAASKLGPCGNAAIVLAMWTGARASSLANVKLSNVDLNPRSGSITYDVAKGGPGRAYTVPLNAEARDALAAWIKVRPPVQHDFLFTAARYPYAPLSRWALHDLWHRRLARHLPKELAAKLRGIHQARHALGRLLAEQGVPIPDIAQVLNHSSLSTVAIYTRPSERDLRRHLNHAIGEDAEE